MCLVYTSVECVSVCVCVCCTFAILYLVEYESTKRILINGWLSVMDKLADLLD